MLCGAAGRLLRGVLAVGIGDVLDAPQAVVHSGLRELHLAGQLAEVQLGILAPPSGHLAERGRQVIELALSPQALDRGRLAEPRADRLADVRCFEVEAAIDLAADLA